MAKKEKSKKADAVAKKSDPASAGTGTSAGTGKAKKAGKERFKGKGKWKGGGADGDDLSTELAALGLRIKDITGDGNCFFRALGDQLQGDERQHMNLRQRVVSYMTEHEADFAPFVEDDESFDSYIARMKKDGVWAGYMEVVAASSCLGVNLTIYQAGQPRWRVIRHAEDSTAMLHLSYHDGQHYNSVRCAHDFGLGPPVPICIRTREGEGTVATNTRQAMRSMAEGGNWDERDVRRVASSTACTAMALVHKALEEACGDVDRAIELVIEALAAQPLEAAAAEPSMGTAGRAGFSPESTSSSSSDQKPVADAGQEHRGGAADAYGTCMVRQGSGAANRAVGGPSGDACGMEGGGDGAGSDEPAASSGTGDRQEPGAAAAEEGDFDVAGAAAVSPPPPQLLLPPAAGKGVRVLCPRVTAVKATGASTLASRRTAAGWAATAATPSNNKPCPCGSHKKYKACCGPAAAAAARRQVAGGAAASDAAAAAADSQSDARVLVAQVEALVI